MAAQEFIKALKTKSKDRLLLTQKLKESDDLIQDVIEVLENQHETEIFTSLCEELFVIYNDHSISESNVACLQFAPALIWAYYCLMAKQVNESSGKVETLLLAIYNQNVRKHTDEPHINSFRIPTISHASVFHEPFSFASTSTLTENALSQHERANDPIMFKGPSKRLDHIPAGLRSTVINSVLQEFNFNLVLYTRPTLVSFCNMVVRLTSCGYKLSDVEYPYLSNDVLSKLVSYPKVRLASNVIQEMVTALQFIAYNGLYSEARPAIQCLRQHCQYSLSFAGVLTTNALQNLLELSIDETEKTLEHGNPERCAFRGKGQSSSIGPERAIFSRSMSMDRNLTEEPPSQQTLKEEFTSPSSIVINIDPASNDGSSNPKLIAADTSTPRNAVVGVEKTGKTETTTATTPTASDETYVVVTTNKKLTFDVAAFGECCNVSSDADKVSEERTPTPTRSVVPVDEGDYDCDKTPLILSESFDVSTITKTIDSDSNSSDDRDRCNSGSPLNIRNEMANTKQPKELAQETKM